MPDLRKLPDPGTRVETGPVQFGDDWPGVFIRGDSAMVLSALLADYIETLVTLGPAAVKHGYTMTPEREKLYEATVGAARSFKEMLDASDISKGEAA